MHIAPTADLPALPGPFKADPITEAGLLLRKAARLPFEARRQRKWARQFSTLVNDARKAVVAHILRAERPDSAINLLSAERPELRPVIERQNGEHETLLLEVFQLAEDAQVLTNPGIWEMVEFTEKAKSLLQALERHQRRMADIAYEASLRGLASEAG